MVDMLSPYTGYHAVSLLEHAGIKVIFPSGQTCCGQPAFNSGYRAEALKVAKTQLNTLLSQSREDQDIPVLLPSGSCAAMMKHHYHDLFSEEVKATDTEVARLRELTVRIADWSKYYHDLNPALVDQGSPTRIAWHGSCHSLREMHVEAEPIALLKKLKAVELITLEHQRECCGFGGTFAVKHAELSTAMADRKWEEILAAEVDALVVSDISCMTHLRTRYEKVYQEQDLARGRVPLRFYHLADFIALRIGIAHSDFNPVTVEQKNE